MDWAEAGKKAFPNMAINRKEIYFTKLVIGLLITKVNFLFVNLFTRNYSFAFPVYIQIKLNFIKTNKWAKQRSFQIIPSTSHHIS
jgi:hypothetical protein